MSNKGLIGFPNGNGNGDPWYGVPARPLAIRECRDDGAGMMAPSSVMEFLRNWHYRPWGFATGSNGGSYGPFVGPAYGTNGLQTNAVANAYAELYSAGPYSGATSAAGPFGISVPPYFDLPQGFLVRWHLFNFTMATNHKLRLYYGMTSSIAGNDPSVRGFGFEVGIDSLSIIAHNGTSFTKTTLGLTVPANSAGELFCSSDGAGNVSLQGQIALSGFVDRVTTVQPVNATSVGGPVTRGAATGNEPTYMLANISNGASAVAGQCWLTHPWVTC